MAILDSEKEQELEMPLDSCESISEKVLDVNEDENLCPCIIDFEKAFDGVKWGKLMGSYRILDSIGGTST